MVCIRTEGKEGGRERDREGVGEGGGEGRRRGKGEEERRKEGSALLEVTAGDNVNYVNQSQLLGAINPSRSGIAFHNRLAPCY